MKYKTMEMLPRDLKFEMTGHQTQPVTKLQISVVNPHNQYALMLKTFRGDERHTFSRVIDTKEELNSMFQGFVDALVAVDYAPHLLNAENKDHYYADHLEGLQQKLEEFQHHDREIETLKENFVAGKLAIPPVPDANKPLAGVMHRIATEEDREWLFRKLTRFLNVHGAPDAAPFTPDCYHFSHEGTATGLTLLNSSEERKISYFLKFENQAEQADIETAIGKILATHQVQPVKELTTRKGASAYASVASEFTHALGKPEHVLEEGASKPVFTIRATPSVYLGPVYQAGTHRQNALNG